MTRSSNDSATTRCARRRTHLDRLALAVLAAALAHGPASADDAEAEPGWRQALLKPNRPELQQPVSGQKRVIAHFMTAMLPAEASEPMWLDPGLYDPDGRTAAVGGLFQTLPVVSLLHPNPLPLKEAAWQEMRTAKALGVDGFNFFYPFHTNEAFIERYERIILAFFEAAEEHNLDFKLTLCFCFAGGNDLTTEQRIEFWAGRLRGLMQKTRQSDHWLRTPDGRILFYTWVPDGILAELDGKHWAIEQQPERVRQVATAYDQIAQRAGVRAAFLYHLRFPESETYVERVFDYFPAVAGWVQAHEALEPWHRIAERARARSRTYVQEVHPDFYTSKVYPRQERGGIIYDVDRALRLGIEGIERHYQVLNLSATFRAKLQMAVDHDVPLINLTTWNDYPEGHHLAPEINHNFGFALLLKHYIARWRGQPDEGPREVAIAFFKKYPAAVKPEPFDVALEDRWTDREPALDDGIEVVTILDDPATLQVNGHKPRDVPAGLHAHRYPMEPGPVHVEVVRDGRTVARFQTPEWITHEPYRTDRLTYSFSSEFARYYELIFGKDTPKHTSMEYAEDEQGVPQWRRGVRTQLAPSPSPAGEAHDAAEPMSCCSPATWADLAVGRDRDADADADADAEDDQ